mmetsp:Transcript_3760/g.9769  ORF Transcript_3760/g.9769 Transcript_3760/m.9769 type:complete len:282 (-) Transcript_3760:1118-1963(-)
MPARKPATDSLSISTTRFWSSRLGSVATSEMSAKSLSALETTALPRTHTYACSESGGAISAARSGFCARSVCVRSPPVCVPISCESATRSCADVPVSSRHAVSSGSSGASSRLRLDASKHTSAYTMPDEGMACVMKRTPLRSVTSIGISRPSRSRSSSESLGSLATSSGESAAAWRSLSSCVALTTCSSCSGAMLSLILASSAASAACCSFSRPRSGVILIVTRWPLPSRSRSIRRWKTGSPRASASLSSASGFSKRRPPSGSRSYSQSESAPIMNMRPRG